MVDPLVVVSMVLRTLPLLDSMKLLTIGSNGSGANCVLMCSIGLCRQLKRPLVMCVVTLLFMLLTPTVLRVTIRRLAPPIDVQTAGTLSGATDCRLTILMSMLHLCCVILVVVSVPASTRLQEISAMLVFLYMILVWSRLTGGRLLGMLFPIGNSFPPLKQTIGPGLPTVVPSSRPLPVGAEGIIMWTLGTPANYALSDRERRVVLRPTRLLGVCSISDTAVRLLNTQRVPVTRPSILLTVTLTKLVKRRLTIGPVLVTVVLMFVLMSVALETGALSMCLGNLLPTLVNRLKTLFRPVTLLLQMNICLLVCTLLSTVL